MKKNDFKKILIMEDHHLGYYAWKQRGFKRLPLVHIDAHIDFGFPEVKDKRLILQEAGSLAELRTQMEKALLFKRYKFDRKSLTNIGNYIYPAMRDGIISEFFWVIPGGMREFKKSLRQIKRILKDLRKKDPFACYRVLFGPGFIKTRLYNKPFCISVLEALPNIKDPVLLDIDTDFLVVDSIKNADAAKNIGKRKLWISPGKLVRTLRKKISLPKFITIAYSINDGFTPMVYKTLGDEIARQLGCSGHDLEKRILAGEYFRSFRDSLDRGNFKEAKRHYLQALKLNPKYRSLDNSYGPLYLGIEDYAKAEKEFRAISKIDREDSFSLSGLGRIYLAKRKFKNAKYYFKKAILLKPDNKGALAGLAQTEFKLRHYPNAKNFISQYERLEPMSGFSRYLLGQIYEKEHKSQEALAKYKEALQLGLDNIDLLINLVKLSKRFEKSNLSYLKKRVEDYKKRFYKIKKKNFKNKGKLSRIKQIECKIKRLNAEPTR